MRARDGYKDPTGLTFWAILFGFATVVSGLVMTIGMWLHPFPEGDEPLDNAHLLLAFSALVYTLSLVVTAILGLFWTFRVAWNARHLGAKGFDSSPAMSVGWYFIPGANIVMPYRALRQVYSASLKPADWNDGAQPIVATWWWLIILSGVVSQIGTMGGDEINALDVVAMAFLTATASVFAVVAKRIASAQVANHARPAGSAIALAPAA